jgi:hypothetical protein
VLTLHQSVDYTFVVPTGTVAAAAAPMPGAAVIE